MRSRNQNLNVAGGLDFVDQKTSIAGGLQRSQDDLRVVYARADGDYRTEIAERPVLVSGGVTLRKGLAVLGGSENGDMHLPRARQAGSLGPQGPGRDRHCPQR